MTPTDPERWRAKAAALLWPTPLEAFEPDGEDARWAELKAAMPWLPGEADSPPAWLRAAASFADGVQRGHRAVQAHTYAADPVFLAISHPLADRSREGAPTLRPVLGRSLTGDWEAEQDWREMLRTLPAELGDLRDPEAYLRLWWHTQAPGGPPPPPRHPDPRRLMDIPGQAGGDFPALLRASLAAAFAPGLASAGDPDLPTVEDLPELVQLKVGPVQPFIEASRRTHDLWMGSYLIAWFTLNAAVEVANRLGPDAVLSPNLRHLPLARRLMLGGGGVHEAELLTAANSNSVLFLCPRAEVQMVAGAAVAGAQAAWTAVAGEVKKCIRESLRGGEGEQLPPGLERWSDGFDQQVADLLECSVVAVPWLAEAGDARPPVQLFGELVGRAALATAGARASAWPTPWTGDHRPKCTVDGVREQMGPKPDPSPFWAELRKDGENALQIRQGEGLSAVTLVRRFCPRAWLGGENSPLGLRWGEAKHRVSLRFPSTRSIAAAPFRAWAAKAPGGRGAAGLQAWGSAVRAVLGEALLPGNLLPGLEPLGGGDLGLAPDGAWLYPSTSDPAVFEREQGGARSDPRLQERLQAVQETLRWLHEDLGTPRERQPTPYYAVLALDVDRLGEVLTGTHPLFELSPEKDEDPRHLPPRDREARRRLLYPALHAAVSERLARLATREIPDVVHAHLGRVVYCGGDDLLALVPLHTALPCAQAVRERIRSWEAGLGAAVTASAGLGIGHSITPMGEVLREARSALHAAKAAGRDRLGVRLDIRSGGLHSVVLPWGGGSTGAAVWVEALVDGRFPGNEGAEPGAPRLNAVVKLQAEWAALGLSSGDGLRPWDWHRLCQLFGWSPAAGAAGGAPAELAWAWPAARPTAGEVLGLLHLARFLRRELPTDDLGPLLDAILPTGARGPRPAAPGGAR